MVWCMVYEFCTCFLCTRYYQLYFTTVPSQQSENATVVARALLQYKITVYQYTVIYCCIYVVFHYLATPISVCMVNPVYSTPIFLASRRVDVSVLFQARVKHGVMQPSATQRTLDSRQSCGFFINEKLLLKAPILN